ncbi:outer membrane usher protein FimD/PapC [Pseudomonas sp. TE36184]
MNTVIHYRDGKAVPGVSPRLALLVLTLSQGLLTNLAWAEQSSTGSFDPQTLLQRGIDPELASLLMQTPRFTQGRHALNLTVNGQRRGRVDVSVDQHGATCFDPPLLDAAQLVTPSSGPAEESSCYAFLEQYPQTVVEHDPANLSLNLVVPTQTLRPLTQDISGYQTGGFAALLNYDVTGLYNHYRNDSSRFGSANTEVGFNAGDWIVRSRQVQTWQDSRSSTTHLDAYAQRTFASHQAVLQAGQINLYNPVLAGAPITGVQVLTEQALQDQNQGATINGIANGPAQVEVRQNGALIHSTVVPAGPFSLSNVPRLNGRSDVEVTVKESTGEERRFTVPAAMLGLGLARARLLGGGRAGAQYRRRPGRRTLGAERRLERRAASAAQLRQRAVGGRGLSLGGPEPGPVAAAGQSGASGRGRLRSLAAHPGTRGADRPVVVAQTE